MAEHHLTLPLSREDAAKLAVGDIVYLSGEMVVTGGLPAHKRIAEHLDRGEPLPIAIDGTFIHLPHMVEEKDGDYVIHYVNPTTSSRFNEFMPRFIRELGLTVVGGKGGLSADAVAAMKEAGCVYVALLGGGSAILSAAIRKVLQVEWRDFPIHFRLTRLLVEELGPFTIGIDAHGHSVYEEVSAQAKARVPEILERLNERRREQTGAS